MKPVITVTYRFVDKRTNKWINYDENILISSVNDVNELSDLIETDNEIAIISFDGESYHFKRNVERVIERKGVTYDAYAKTPYKYNNKITWDNGYGIYKTKKEAIQQRVEIFEKNLNKLVVKLSLKVIN